MFPYCSKSHSSQRAHKVSTNYYSCKFSVRKELQKVFLSHHFCHGTQSEQTLKTVIWNNSDGVEDRQLTTEFITRTEKTGSLIHQWDCSSSFEGVFWKIQTKGFSTGSHESRKCEALTLESSCFTSSFLLISLCGTADSVSSVSLQSTYFHIICAILIIRKSKCSSLFKTFTLFNVYRFFNS